MNLQEIKTALDEGDRVFWSNNDYEVIKDNFNQYLIKCHQNDYCRGLTHQDNITLSEHEENFYIGLKKPYHFFASENAKLHLMDIIENYINHSDIEIENENELRNIVMQVRAQ